MDDSNEYLKKFNPENKQAIDDIVALGRVSNTYARQMDEFGELLDNSAEISDTVVDKESELEDFFDEGDKFADVLRKFIDAAGDDIIATAANSVQPLSVGAEYSEMFPCWFKGQNALIDDVVNGTFKNNTLHIAMKTVTPQPTRYGKPGDPEPERPIIPKESTLESIDLAQPQIHGYKPNPTDPDNPYPAGLGTICDELYQAAAGNPRSPDKPLPVPPELWKIIGIKNSHNGKLGTEADFDRAPVSSTGIDRDSDAASLLLGPVVHGGAVSAR